MLRGRRIIYTDAKVITKENVISEVNKALLFHNMNVQEEQYLFEYESGSQPIDEREKEIRPEINIKVRENNATKIVDFKIGYEFGNPITYVQRARTDKHSDANSDDYGVSLINEMMSEQSKATKDVELARNFKIGGLGYRMALPNKDQGDFSPFKIMTPNPLTTFVVYSNDVYREPVFGVTYVVHDDGACDFGVYTRDKYFEYGTEIIGGSGFGVKESPNLIGEIPIVEYVNNFNRTGCFEQVIPIMDALNITDSDRVNDIAQHVQSLLWAHNVEIKEEQLKSGEIIETSSTGNGQSPIIKYLNDMLDQSGAQELANYLNQQIMEICGVPMRSENGGGSTGSAVSLSSGWQMAETNARTSESIFEQSERRFLKVILSIIKNAKDMPSEVVEIELSDIQPKFSRNKTYDLISKANALATLAGIGTDGLTAFNTVGLFTDPQQAWNDSKEMYQKIQDSKATTGQKTEKLQADASDQPSKVPNVE